MKNSLKKLYYRTTSIIFVSDMENGRIRQIFLYKDYFSTFFAKQKPRVREKILWTFRIIETIQQVPIEYLKRIEGTEGLYEIRIQLGRDIFRIFCFFDKGKLVVLTNGFQKKTQKTPKKEIEKALKIKREYELEFTILNHEK